MSPCLTGNRKRDSLGACLRTARQAFPMFGVTDYGAFVIAFIIVLAIPGPGNFALITATGLRGDPG